MKFEFIPVSQVHPVTLYGYDPIPGNGGQYHWDQKDQTYKPGVRP